MENHPKIADPWRELTPRQMEVLAETARIVLDGTTQPTFTEVATRLGIWHQPLSALRFKGYLARGGRRGPGVTLTRRGWAAIARAYGPWREPTGPQEEPSGEFTLLREAHDALAHVLAGGRPRFKDHEILRTLRQYLGDGTSSRGRSDASASRRRVHRETKPPRLQAKQRRPRSRPAES